MKETEFDRYERMKKLEREAEAEKRKSTEFEGKKKSGKPKLEVMPKRQNWGRSYAFAIGDDEYDEM